MVLVAILAADSKTVEQGTTFLLMAAYAAVLIFLTYELRFLRRTPETQGAAILLGQVIAGAMFVFIADIIVVGVGWVSGRSATLLARLIMLGAANLFVVAALATIVVAASFRLRRLMRAREENVP